MNRNTAVTLAYLVAVAFVLVITRSLSGYASPGVIGILPFAVLLFAVQESRGRALVTAGLILLGAAPIAAHARLGWLWLWLPAACIGAASYAFSAAFVCRETRPRRRMLMWILGAAAVIVAGMLMASILTNWANGILAFFTFGALVELALVTLVVFASVASWRTGAGAMAMLLGANAWLLWTFSIPITPAAAVLLWYLGTFLVTRPWTTSPAPAQRG